MKRNWIRAAVLAAFGLAAPWAQALDAVDPSWSATPYYDAGSGNDIVSYDWDASGDLFTMTSVDYFFGGFYRVSGGVTTAVVPGSGSEFAGGSVLSLGGHVYFNTSDFSNTQKIFRYGPGGVSQISTTPNYGLYTSGGALYITGAAGFGANHIYHSALDAGGGLVSNPATDLGVTSGSPGPLAFDTAGNLYYAPGYSDLSLYRWSAEEVAAALADPLVDPLSVEGHLWADYSGLYGGLSGATSLLFDDGGDLLVTLSGFTDPSVLALFDVDEEGLFGGASTLFTSLERLGDLRRYDNRLFLADGAAIYEVVPEPSALLLLAAAGAAWFLLRRRRSAVAALVTLAGTAALHAGPYSQGANDPTNPYDAPIPGYVGPEGDGVVGGTNGVNPLFIGWATQVVDYSPAPGVQAAFGDSTKALGPVAEADTEPNTVSLGDLSGSGTPGSITLGFELKITNGTGADFAVFENGFFSLYTTGDGSVAGKMIAELAYVEVSTDGVNFARFPSISLTPAATGAYGTIDPSDVYNLAGKHVNEQGESWGTPFDLDALADDLLVTGGLIDLNDINFIRLVDIPGSGAYLDSEGNPIYDAWVTFGSGGFDLEAVGIINTIPEPSSLALALAALGGGWALRRKRG